MSDYPLSQSLGYLLARSSRKLSTFANQRLAEAGFDISIEQWAVIHHLGLSDGLNQADLADLLDKDKTSVARLLAKMERNNLLLRIQDRNDRRNKQVYLTHQGKEHYAQVPKVLFSILDEVQEGVLAADLERTKAVLVQVFENIQAIEK